MKTRFAFLLLVIFMSSLTSFSQEKTKKELKAEKKLEQQKIISGLMDSREFKFVGRTALPTGMKSVNLSSNPNFMKFSPDLIESQMPFFGRAYSAIGYGGDTGLKFKAKPEKFDIVRKTKTYEVEAEVRGETDNFKISLSVGFEGNSTLTVISGNRSTISYHGEVFPPDK